MLASVGDWLYTQRKRKMMDKRNMGCYCSLSHPQVSGCFWQSRCTNGDMLELSISLIIFFLLLLLHTMQCDLLLSWKRTSREGSP